jgi:hypothetical protein
LRRHVDSRSVRKAVKTREKEAIEAKEVFVRPRPTLSPIIDRLPNRSTGSESYDTVTGDSHKLSREDDDTPITPLPSENGYFRTFVRHAHAHLSYDRSPPLALVRTHSYAYPRTHALLVTPLRLSNDRSLACTTFASCIGRLFVRSTLCTVHIRPT